MFSSTKIDIRRVASILFLSAMLFFGSTLIGNTNHTNAIAASAITRDATNLNTTDVVSDREYEQKKAERQQEQAMRSQRAEAQAEYEAENESVAEKLNLDEALPRSTKKFVEQITGDEPINNETRP